VDGEGGGIRSEAGQEFAHRSKAQKTILSHGPCRVGGRNIYAIRQENSVEIPPPLRANEFLPSLFAIPPYARSSFPSDGLDPAHVRDWLAMPFCGLPCNPAYRRSSCGLRWLQGHAGVLRRCCGVVEAVIGKRPTTVERAYCTLCGCARPIGPCILRQGCHAVFFTRHPFSTERCMVRLLLCCTNLFLSDRK
jgi:hypothetical protein